MTAAIWEMALAWLAATPGEKIAGNDIEVQSFVVCSFNQEFDTVLDKRQHSDILEDEREMACAQIRIVFYVMHFQEH